MMPTPPTFDVIGGDPSDAAIAALARILLASVDPDASPADWDDALARFLLAYVRQQSRSSSAAPAAEVEFQTTPQQ